MSKDYYAKELAFQGRIIAKNNERLLKESIIHHVDEEAVMVQLPESMWKEKVEGKITFYCPASSKKDRVFPMKFNEEGRQYIMRKDLEKGAYHLQMSWTLNGKEFYKEEVINIP